MRFSPVWGINLIPYTVCKSRLCRRILSRLRADLRENPTKQWASRDTLIQSTGSISNSARYHNDANIALGPILKMYIPGQIRISNALNSDGYSTGNAPPSGNNYSWSSTDSSCSNYICVISDFIATKVHLILEVWRYINFLLFWNSDYSWYHSIHMILFLCIKMHSQVTICMINIFFI